MTLHTCTWLTREMSWKQRNYEKCPYRGETSGQSEWILQGNFFRWPKRLMLILLRTKPLRHLKSLTSYCLGDFQELQCWSQEHKYQTRIHQWLILKLYSDRFLLQWTLTESTLNDYQIVHTTSYPLETNSQSKNHILELFILPQFNQTFLFIGISHCSTSFHYLILSFSSCHWMNSIIGQ